MRRLSRALWALSVFCWAPGIAAAQSVGGQVVNEANQAVSGVTVTLLDSAGAVLGQQITETDGRFTLAAPEPGKYRLRFQVAGYRVLVTPWLDLLSGETVDYSLTLLPLAPALLDTLLVEGRPIAWNLVGFYQRRRVGQGYFATSEEWNRWAAFDVNDVVRHLNPLIGAGGRGCSGWPIYLDGSPMPADFDVTQHGLRKLEVHERNGVIFASFCPEVEPFEAYLGESMLQLFDRVYDGRRLSVLGYSRQLIPANWKLMFENIKDPYHASLLHVFLVTFGLFRADNPSRVRMDRTGRHGALISERGEQRKNAEVAEMAGQELAHGRLCAAVVQTLGGVPVMELPPLPAVPLVSWEGVGLLAEQALIGIAMGFTMRLVFAAVQAVNGRDSVTLTGTAEVRGHVERAAVLAVLDATNRWAELRRPA